MIEANYGPCLLVKTGSEIALKSDHVRTYFTKKLVLNIKHALKNKGVGLERVARGGGRLYLFAPELEKVAEIMKYTVGVHAVAFAERKKWKEYSDVEQPVLEYAKRILKKGDSFAVRARRVKTVEITSKDFEIKLGATIMDAIPGLSVKLKKPDKTIFVEVRQRDFFVFADSISCPRGLPLGVEGNLAFEFKGEKNELTAALLLMFRGCNIHPVVAKKTKALEAHINKLKKFNAFREFLFTEEKDFEKLVKEREVQAVGTADEGVSEKALKAYAKHDSKSKLVVIRPLLLYPNSIRKEKEAMIA